jgi:hypothetical protein
VKLSLLLLMAVFAVGCGSTDSSPLEEGGDARPDGRMKDRSISEDGRAEARPDSSWKEDGPVDTGGKDGPSDTGTDLGMDAPVDSGTLDTGTDVGTDVGSDTGTRLAARSRRPTRELGVR